MPLVLLVQEQQQLLLLVVMSRILRVFYSPGEEGSFKPPLLQRFSLVSEKGTS